ncbi:MAG: helix-turn-helix domain-containing protein [Chloroflexota bacterium]|nr:helix-turn-helix domain-containing protein [Chloroflexota bacterium]
MTHRAVDPTLFLSIKELAIITGLSAKTLHAQAAKGTLPLPTLRFGSRYLIPRKALEDLGGRSVYGAKIEREDLVEQ